MKKVMTGNTAAAWGARLSRVDVIATYPITPQTMIMEKLAEWVEKGEFPAQYIQTESEHSSLAACIAAASVGARTYTATSSHGLALMHELLFWAAGARLPVVLTDVNRALAPPWNIWTDHIDTVAERDTGCLQLYCESNQEVLDMMPLAYRVAEDRRVLLPMMVVLDAFVLSHTSEVVDIPSQGLVDQFLPKFSPEFTLDPSKPVALGSVAMPDQFMEFRYRASLAMDRAPTVIREALREFEQLFGRSYGGLVEEYRCEDAGVVLVVAGSAASTAKAVADELRAEGHKVGVARLRVFRPFPVEELRALGRRVGTLGVLERAYAFGPNGAFTTELKGALFGLPDPPRVKNYIAGLGGRDIVPQEIRRMFLDLERVESRGLDREVEWVGVHGLPWAEGIP